MISTCSASALGLAGLHLVEQGIKPLVAGVPELPVGFQPLVSLRKRGDFKTSRPALRIAAAGNQAGTFQYSEMLGDRRLAHGEGRSQFGDRGIARCQPSEDRPASWIGERSEGCIQRARSITMWLHNY